MVTGALAGPLVKLVPTGMRLAAVSAGGRQPTRRATNSLWEAMPCSSVRMLSWRASMALRRDSTLGFSLADRQPCKLKKAARPTATEKAFMKLPRDSGTFFKHDSRGTISKTRLLETGVPGSFSPASEPRGGGRVEQQHRFRMILEGQGDRQALV